jgi:hypothetical protein
MKLGAFLMAGGHHIAGWRHPDAHAHAGVDVEHFIALALMAPHGSAWSPPHPRPTTTPMGWREHSPRSIN